MVDIDPAAEIAEIEARIDELRDRLESCRKGLVVSRAVLLAGGVWLALAALRVLPSVEGLFLSIAACLGGVVGIGANVSTRRQTDAELRRRVAERDSIIDALDPRLLT